MAKQATSTKKSTGKSARKQLSEQDRLAMVAEAAYLRAAARGFSVGHEDEDWLAAEAEVNARLANGKQA